MERKHRKMIKGVILWVAPPKIETYFYSEEKLYDFKIIQPIIHSYVGSVSLWTDFKDILLQEIIWFDFLKKKRINLAQVAFYPLRDMHFKRLRRMIQFSHAEYLLSACRLFKSI